MALELLLRGIKLQESAAAGTLEGHGCAHQVPSSYAKYYVHFITFTYSLQVVDIH
jgi:hypothetical protein